MEARDPQKSENRKQEVKECGDKKQFSLSLEPVSEEEPEIRGRSTDGSESLQINSDADNSQEKPEEPFCQSKVSVNVMKFDSEMKSGNSPFSGATGGNKSMIIPQRKVVPEVYKRLPVATVKQSRRNKKVRGVLKSRKKCHLVKIAEMFTSVVMSLMREKSTTGDRTPLVRHAGKKEESTGAPSAGFRKAVIWKNSPSETLSDGLERTSINRGGIQTEFRKPADSRQKKYQLIERVVTIMEDDVVQAEDIEILLKGLNVKVTKASKSGDNQSAATLSNCENCNAETKSSSNKYIYNEGEEKASGMSSSTSSTSGVSLSLTDSAVGPLVNSDSRDDQSEASFDLSSSSSLIEVSELYIRLYS